MHEEIKVLSFDFITFLSSNYGSGNLGFDLSMIGFTAVGVIMILAIMQAVSLGRSFSSKESELLADVSELLHEMNIHMHELKSEVHQEFTKVTAELEFIRRQFQAIEVEDLWSQKNTAPPQKEGSNSLMDLFQ